MLKLFLKTQYSTNKLPQAENKHLFGDLKKKNCDEDMHFLQINYSADPPFLCLLSWKQTEPMKLVQTARAQDS